MKSLRGKLSPDLIIYWFNCNSRTVCMYLSCRIVCETTKSGGEKSGQASVKVRGGGLGLSAQVFSFQVNAA